MPDKRTKALKTANIRISTLVWKLHREIESAKEQDISFTKVDTVRKLATDTFKLFIKHGVLDEKAHLKIRSPPPANLDRRQNVSTTAFCDDVKKRLNYEDDETHDCIERNPRKPREFEEKYKETNLENIRLGQEFDCFERSPRKPRDFEEKYIKAKLENIHLQQEFDCFERSPRKPRDFEEKYKKAKLENIHLQQELSRVQKCIGELEYQSKCLIYQVDLAEKEKSDVSRKDDMRYKHLESEVNRYKAEINDLLHSDSSNNHRVHANRYRSERDLARCEIEELKIELEKRKDNSLQSDLEYLKKTLKRTEIDLKSVKDKNTVLRHTNENKTKMIEEIQNRAVEEIKDANDAIVYYKEEQQRYKKAKDDNNAKIVKLRTEKENANGRIAKLTNERDDANRK